MGLPQFLALYGAMTLGTAYYAFKIMRKRWHGLFRFHHRVGFGAMAILIGLRWPLNLFEGLCKLSAQVVDGER